VEATTGSLNFVDVSMMGTGRVCTTAEFIEVVAYMRRSVDHKTQEWFRQGGSLKWLAQDEQRSCQAPRLPFSHQFPK
jgi:hypothetical protein